MMALLRFCRIGQRGQSQALARALASLEPSTQAPKEATGPLPRAPFFPVQSLLQEHMLVVLTLGLGGT